MFYAKVFNIDLRHVYDGEIPVERLDRKNLIYSSKGEFKEVHSPDFGDLIIIRIFGIESHIAVYIGEGKMLHTSKSTGSVVEPLSRFVKLISGYYRLAND